jgi:hypothetical protein
VHQQEYFIKDLTRRKTVIWVIPLHLGVGVAFCIYFRFVRSVRPDHWSKYVKTIFGWPIVLCLIALGEL